MKIGELSKRTGLAASRIRFYEKSGLINGVERKENGYRQYGPEALWILEIVAGAQSAGFSLEEIRTLLPDTKKTWRHDELLESLQRKVVEIELMQKRLKQNKSQLLLAIDSIKNRPLDLACSDRPQWVLNQIHAQSAKPLK